MPVLVNSRTKRRFIGLFDSLEESTSLIPFANNEVGFSFKKSSTGTAGYVSLIKVAVFDQPAGSRKDLYIGATYGEDRGSGVAIRIYEAVNPFDPVDLEVRGKYQYDADQNKLYRGNQQISAEELLNEFYDKHIKSTKRFAGFVVRWRLRFWRNYAVKTVQALSETASAILYVTSGIHYRYDPLWDALDESNSLRQSVRPATESTTAGKTFSFLGYEAPSWTVVIYCIIHIALYIIFYALSWRPGLVTTMLKNNFLTLVYVVVSLSLLEVAIPRFLKYLIRKFSTLAETFQFKKVKVW